MLREFTGVYVYETFLGFPTIALCGMPQALLLLKQGTKPPLLTEYKGDFALGFIWAKQSLKEKKIMDTTGN